MRVRLCLFSLAILFGIIPEMLTAAGETLPAPATGGSIETVAGEGPRIRFQKETANLGDILQGQTGETVFVFLNEGTAPLQIVEVKSS